MRPRKLVEAVEGEKWDYLDELRLFEFEPDDWCLYWNRAGPDLLHFIGGHHPYALSRTRGPWRRRFTFTRDKEAGSCEARS